MDKEKYMKVLEDTLRAAKANGYAGYSKFDALNSKFLSAITLGSAWLRFACIQMVKISPWNLRPLFGVTISPNPKGIALFARAYFSIYEVTHDEEALREARSLLAWLVEHRCVGQEQFAWGYNYTWQDIPPFVQWKGEPVSIVTIFAAEAFLHGYNVTGQKEYLDIARSAARFLTQTLKRLRETEDELAIAYTLGKENGIVVNIQALCAALLAKIWIHTNEQELLEFARKQITFVLRCTTPYDAWFYTYPPEKSHIRHDNYHTGGILDALLEYAEATGDRIALDAYWKGLAYYEKHLFEADCAPRWMNDSKFPHDVHGSAQGIITFAKAAKLKKEYREVAMRIADWSLSNLFRPELHDFRYRRGKYLDYNYSLMHWCNGWMTRALGEFINI